MARNRKGNRLLTGKVKNGGGGDGGNANRFPDPEPDDPVTLDAQNLRDAQILRVTGDPGHDDPKGRPAKARRARDETPRFGPLEPVELPVDDAPPAALAALVVARDYAPFELARQGLLRTRAAELAELCGGDVPSTASAAMAAWTHLYTAGEYWASRHRSSRDPAHLKSAREAFAAAGVEEERMRTCATWEAKARGSRSSSPLAEALATPPPRKAKARAKRLSRADGVELDLGGMAGVKVGGRGPRRGGGGG